MHRHVNVNNTTKIRRISLSTTLPALVRTNDPENLSLLAHIPKGLSYPVDIIVCSKNARRKSKLVKQHVYTRQLPDWCFIRINDKVAVSAPALCFFQMASELPLIKLIELGFEFCGTYSRHENRADKESDPASKTIYGHQLLTNVKTLKAFSNLMVGVSGNKRTCRALRYIANGSASPMETILFMLLTLPYKLGGYGLRGAELNRRIDLRKAARQRSGKSYYVCDIFWAEANLAIEYDSNMYHTGADRIADDSKKRIELEAYGITVVTVTSIQIRSIKDFEALAKLVARKLGKQLQYKNPRFLIAHRELRDMLL